MNKLRKYQQWFILLFVLADYLYQSNVRSRSINRSLHCDKIRSHYFNINSARSSLPSKPFSRDPYIVKSPYRSCGGGCAGERRGKHIGQKKPIARKTGLRCRGCCRVRCSLSLKSCSTLRYTAIISSQKPSACREGCTILAQISACSTEVIAPIRGTYEPNVAQQFRREKMSFVSFVLYRQMLLFYSYFIIW